MELSADLRMASAASAFVNYSWQGQPQPTGFAASELNVPPSHRFNTGLSATHNRYFGSVTASYISGAYWQDVLPEYQGWTVGYIVIDGGNSHYPDTNRRTKALAEKGILFIGTGVLMSVNRHRKLVQT